MLKKAMAVLVAGLFLAGLSACNTVQGIGKDIEKGGEAIQKAAK
jgi:entericidin B